MSDYGFSKSDKEYLAKKGYTPEEARNLVVKKLKKANLNKRDLDKFSGPVDKLDWYSVDTIMEIMYREGGDYPQPESYLKVAGGDLSDHVDYMTFRVALGD